MRGRFFVQFDEKIMLDKIDLMWYNWPGVDWRHARNFVVNRHFE